MSERGKETRLPSYRPHPDPLPGGEGEVLPSYRPDPYRLPGGGAEEGLDFVALARRRQPWRSLEELAETPEFQRALRGESSEKMVEEAAGFDRRELFQYLGVSMALAGLTACTRQPEEKIVPYVRQPEDVIPGRPQFYATAMTVGGFATGLLVESHQGRPTKVEGNALHPASLGATDAFAQAATWGLYDPDRSQTVLYLEEIRPWSAFLGAVRVALDAERSAGGEGIAILTLTAA